MHVGIPTCPSQDENWQTHTHAKQLSTPEITSVSAIRRSRNGLAEEFATKADVHSSRPSTPRSRSCQSMAGARVARFLQVLPGFHLEMLSAESLRTLGTWREPKCQPATSSIAPIRRMRASNQGPLPPPPPPDNAAPSLLQPCCHLAATHNPCPPRDAHRTPQPTYMRTSPCRTARRY